LVAVESEIKGGSGLDVTPYDPNPGTEATSPTDSTPVEEFTNGVAEKWPRSMIKRKLKRPRALPLRCR